jgi:hypothetical protein
MQGPGHNACGLPDGRRRPEGVGLGMMFGSPQAVPNRTRGVKNLPKVTWRAWFPHKVSRSINALRAHVQIVVTDNQRGVGKTQQGVAGKRQWLVNDLGATRDLLKADLGC